MDIEKIAKAGETDAGGAPATAFDELVALLTAAAAACGDGIEVDDRRGADVIGIRLYSLTPGASHTLASEWMHNLDGMTTTEALRATRDKLPQRHL